MDFIQKRNIVLASGSPRRKAYLDRYSLKFRILTGSVDEISQLGEDPVSFANRMASEKADAILNECHADEIVIAADTIVVFDGKILGKPNSQVDIYPMLSVLNGNKHEVITSYVIHDCQNNSRIQNKAITEVTFHNLPANILKIYASSNEPQDKAGSYSIQGVGTFLVSSINGSYNNVVGLPIELLIRDMIELGYLEF